MKLCFERLGMASQCANVIRHVSVCRRGSARSKVQDCNVRPACNDFGRQHRDLCKEDAAPCGARAHAATAARTAQSHRHLCKLVKS